MLSQYVAQGCNLTHGSFHPVIDLAVDTRTMMIRQTGKGSRSCRINRKRFLVAVSPWEGGGGPTSPWKEPKQISKSVQTEKRSYKK